MSVTTNPKRKKGAESLGWFCLEKRAVEKEHGALSFGRTFFSGSAAQLRQGQRRSAARESVHDASERSRAPTGVHFNLLMRANPGNYCALDVEDVEDVQRRPGMKWGCGGPWKLNSACEPAVEKRQ